MDILLLTIILVGHLLAKIGALTPTIVENPNFDAESEADKLYSAISKKKTDTITSIICSINNQQRLMLAEEFKKSYGIEVTKMLTKMEKLFKNENYIKLMVALMKPPIHYDAYHMYTAIKEKQNSVLIEILATRTNEQIAQIRNVYSKQTAGQDLENDISENFSGPFRRLLISLINYSRDESDNHDAAKAKEEAQKLYNWRRKAFNKVFARRNLIQLGLIINEYNSIEAGKDIQKGIQKVFKSAYDQDGYLVLIKYVKNSSDYFANLLLSSFSFIGKNDAALIRLLVSRSEIDLADIEKSFNSPHKKTLKDRIKKKANGAYQKALFALLTKEETQQHGEHRNATSTTKKTGEGDDLRHHNDEHESETEEFEDSGNEASPEKK